MELDPGSVDVRLQYAYWYLRPLRRLQDARAQYRRILEVDPLSSFTYYTISESYFWEGRFAAMIEPAAKALEIDPNYWPPVTMLATAYAHMGQHDEADRCMEQARQLAPHEITVRAITGMLRALRGDRETAHQAIAELESRTGFARSPAMLASLYDSVGDVDTSYRLVEELIESRTARVFWILAPSYANLQQDSRYPGLLRRLNVSADLEMHQNRRSEVAPSNF